MQKHHLPFCRSGNSIGITQNYTWAIPTTLANKVQPGIRVEVVLGKQKNMQALLNPYLRLDQPASNPNQF